MERKQDERDRQHVYLLRRAGYTRLEQLSGVSYEHVHRALRETNEREKISGDLPSQETINLWILQGGRGEKGTIRGISGRGALLSMDSLAGPEDTTMRLDPDLFPTDQE